MSTENTRKVRVRFAPSPTGPLHMGGVRTALYNYLFARKHGGDFILRIEDTDQNRFVSGAEEYIVAALGWCGLTSDEGPDCGGPHAPYRQSERNSIYAEYAGRLISSGNAYYAFDTAEELEQMRTKLGSSGSAAPQYNYISREGMKNSLTLSEDEVARRLQEGQPHVIRIKVPRKEEIKFHDLIRGNILVHSAQVDDKVLFKSDGRPTYHLANVVDDYLMDISHVIRGEEWLPSAPVHVLLYRYLGWENKMPLFAHLPLLLRPDGNGKLSKRDGDRLGFPVFPLNWTDPSTGEESSGYREKSFYPESFVNMLALLGWNPGSNQEIFSIEELISIFSIERIHKAGAKFDYGKALWFNQTYLRARSDEDLAGEFEVVLKEKQIAYDKSYIIQCCRLLKDKAQLSSQFWELGSYLFEDPVLDFGLVQKKWTEPAASFFIKLISSLESMNSFSELEIEQAFNTVAADLSLKPSSMLQLFRILVTGLTTGPPLFILMSVLGAPVVTRRLRKSVETVKNLAG